MLATFFLNETREIFGFDPIKGTTSTVRCHRACEVRGDKRAHSCLETKRVQSASLRC